MYHLNNGHSSETHPSRYYRPPASKAATGGETSLRRTLRVLDRRKWTLVLVVAGFITLAVLFAKSRPVVYRSEAQIEVGAETPLTESDLLRPGGHKSLPPWENHFNTQKALLVREGLLKNVLESFKDRPGVIAEFTNSPDPVRKLADQLKVEGLPSTFVIKVALEHLDPSSGPEIVNRLITFHMADSKKRIEELAMSVSRDLETNTLPALQKQVIDAEKRIQEFRMQNGGDIRDRHDTFRGERDRIVARIFELRRDSYRFRYGPGREDPRDLDPDSLLGSARLIEGLIDSRTRVQTELAEKSSEYKEQHPTMIGLKNKLAAITSDLNEALGFATKSRDKRLATEAERLDKDLKGADAEMKALLSDQEQVQKAIEEVSVALAQHHRLESELDAAQESHNTYLKTLADLRARAGAGLAAVRVVDLSHSPVGKKKDTQLILSLGAVLGLLFGAAAVILAEQNDDRASMPYEAEEAVGLDVLVSVPKLPRSIGHRGPVLPKDNPLKSPLEPFRRLRAEVQARLLHVEGARVVAVLGAGAGEGKSTVAVNLARVLGLEKRNVLLVDAEFRRPRLKALLGDANKPGLEEFVRADAHFRDCVQTTQYPNVDVIGAAKPMDEAPELAGLARFKELVEKARAFYDYIIIDSGPVNVFSESAVVATGADASILVMDERRSKLRNVLSARKLLENLQVRILGLIVNRSHNPEAGGLISRYIAEVHSNGNGHANGNGAIPAPVMVAAAAPAPAPIFVQSEDTTMKQLLDRVFMEFDDTKQRASALESDRQGLKQAVEESERDYNRRLESELRKNAELAEKFSEFVESSRGREEEQLKKLEVIFTKSLDGVNKKLTDLRLRSFAGGGGGGGGGAMEGDLQLRPSQATIDGIFNQKVESNLGAMDKPKAKSGGNVNNALDRLKNMRANSTPKKDEEKK
jgi:capsular exopolysaccharide synthesis family protein